VKKVVILFMQAGGEGGKDKVDLVKNRRCPYFLFIRKLHYFCNFFNEK